jgi:hypothetical protein
MFPIHENLKFEIFAEAFNIANRRHIISQSTTAYTVGACSGHSNACISPFTATAFGAPTATTSVLYGPRQLQFTAKLWF